MGNSVTYIPERRRITNYSGTSASLHLTGGESLELKSGESIEVDSETTSLTMGGRTVRLKDCLYRYRYLETPTSRWERMLLEAERSAQTLGNYMVHYSSHGGYKILEIAVPSTDNEDYGDLSQFDIKSCDSPTHLKCSSDCQGHRTASRVWRNESSYLIPIICGHLLGNVFHLAPGCRTKYSGVYSYPTGVALLNGKAESYRIITRGGLHNVFTNNTYWRVNISNQTPDSLTVVCNEETIVIGPRSFRECSVVQSIVTMKGLTWPQPKRLVDGLSLESSFDDYTFMASSANNVTSICVTVRRGG